MQCKILHWFYLIYYSYSFLISYEPVNSADSGSQYNLSYDTMSINTAKPNLISFLNKFQLPCQSCIVWFSYHTLKNSSFSDSELNEIIFKLISRTITNLPTYLIMGSKGLLPGEFAEEQFVKIISSRPNIKCSFAILSHQAILHTTKMRHHKWFRSCSSTYPCYHFTILGNNNLNLNPSIKIQNSNSSSIRESVAIEVVLLGQKTPTYHFILEETNNSIITICSSRSKQFNYINFNTLNTLEQLVSTSIKECQSSSAERYLRIFSHWFGEHNLNQIFQWKKEKSIHIFRSISNSELNLQMQLALTLNATAQISAIAYFYSIEKLISKLTLNEADLGLGLPFSAKLSELLDFSPHVSSIDKYTFFIRKPTPRPLAVAFLVQPFSTLLWTVICICLVFLPCFVISTTRKKLFSIYNTHFKLFSYIVETFQTFQLPLIEQSFNVNSVHLRLHGTTKFILGFWLLSSILLHSLYKSKLISMLVLPTYDYPPRTFQELLESPKNYKLYNPGFPNYSAFAFDLSTSGIPIATLLLNRLQDVTPSVEKDSIEICMDHSMNKSEFSSCIGPKKYFSYSFFLTTTNKLEDLYESQQHLLPFVALIPLPKNSQLKEPLGQLIADLTSTGICHPDDGVWTRLLIFYSTFFLDWRKSYKIRTQKILNETQSSVTKEYDEDDSIVISRTHVNYFLYFLATGCLLGLIVLLIECLKASIHNIGNLMTPFRFLYKTN